MLVFYRVLLSQTTIDVIENGDASVTIYTAPLLKGDSDEVVGQATLSSSAVDDSVAFQIVENVVFVSNEFDQTLFGQAYYVINEDEEVLKKQLNRERDVDLGASRLAALQRAGFVALHPNGNPNFYGHGGYVPPDAAELNWIGNDNPDVEKRRANKSKKRRALPRFVHNTVRGDRSIKTTKKGARKTRGKAKDAHDDDDDTIVIYLSGAITGGLGEQAPYKGMYGITPDDVEEDVVLYIGIIFCREGVQCI